MNRTIVFAAVVAAAAAAAGYATGARAEDAARFLGVAYSHQSVEKFEMSVGVTAGEQPRRPRRIQEDREVLSVPAHYGTLETVTGNADVSVFWFRNTEGELRNVLVRDSAARALKIRSVPTSRYEADAREERR